MSQRFEFVDDRRNLTQFVVTQIEKGQSPLKRRHRVGKGRQVVFLHGQGLNERKKAKWGFINSRNALVSNSAASHLHSVQCKRLGILL